MSRRLIDKTKEPRLQTRHGTGQWKFVPALVALMLGLFTTSTAHAEIAYRAAASANNGSGGSSLTINKPAGVVSGDFMLAGIADVGASGSISAPSGWTLVRQLSDGFNLRIYRKAAGASEPSSYTWTRSASGRISGGIVAFSGVDATTPIQAENGAIEGTTVKTTHATPTITTSGSSTWLVSIFADRRESGAFSTWTPPSGTTERVDVHTAIAAATNSSLAINTVGPVAAGSKSHTATASGSSQYACMEIIALNAAAGGSPPNAPSNLNATAVSSSQINLAWTDNSSDETGFKIERKAGSGGTYSQIATVGAGVTSYNNSGLSASTTYYYRVRAYNGSGDSSFSNEANATTQAQTYDGVVASFDPNVVSYWKFENNGNDQKGVQAATITGSPELNVPTIVDLDTIAEGAPANGQCIAWSGGTGQYAQASHNAAHKTANGTIVVTFQRDSATEKATLVAADANSAAGGLSIEVNTDGSPRAFLKNASGTAVILTGTAGDVALNAAYTLIFKWGTGGLSLALYNDAGTLVRRITNTLADGVTGTSPIRFGAWHTDVAHHDGPFGRVVWLNRRISDAEETTLARAKTIVRTSDTYDSRVAGFDPNVVSYWKFENNGNDQKGVQAATITGSPELNVPTIVDLDTLAEGAPANGQCIAWSGGTGQYAQASHNAAHKTANGTIVVTFQRDTATEKATLVAADANSAAGGLSVEVNTDGSARAFLRNSAGSAVILTGTAGDVALNAAYTLIFKWGTGGLSLALYNDAGTLVRRVTNTLTDGVTGTSPIRFGAWHTDVSHHDGPYGRVIWLNRRISDAEESTLARARTITHGGGAPAAPSGLTATTISSSQINLAWTDNSSDETGFKVERKTGSGGTYAQIATPGANATSYNNTGLATGTTYYYRVRAYNGSGDSAFSNEANATTTTSGTGFPILEPDGGPGTLDTTHKNLGLIYRTNDNQVRRPTTGGNARYDFRGSGGGVTGVGAAMTNHGSNDFDWAGAGGASPGNGKRCLIKIDTSSSIPSAAHNGAYFAGGYGIWSNSGPNGAASTGEGDKALNAGSDINWDPMYKSSNHPRPMIYLLGRSGGQQHNLVFDGFRSHGFGWDVLQLWDEAPASSLVSNITLKRTAITLQRDDAIENDQWVNNVIMEDNLIEAMVAFSCNNSGFDGSSRTNTMQNNLFYVLRIRISQVSERISGRYIKLDPRAVRLRIINNIFAVPAHSSILGNDNNNGPFSDLMKFNKMHPDSTGNKICWLGSGSYPYNNPDPSRFTVLTGSEAQDTWNNAKAAWWNTFPGHRFSFDPPAP